MLVGLVLGYGAMQPADHPADRRGRARRRSTTRSRPQTPPPAFAEGIYAAIQPSIVLIDADRDTGEATPTTGEGTGVVVSDAGEVLTAFHVVDGADTITLTLRRRHQESPATVTDQDQENDIAVVTPDEAPRVVARRCSATRPASRSAATRTSSATRSASTAR